MIFGRNIDYKRTILFNDMASDNVRVNVEMQKKLSLKKVSKENTLKPCEKNIWQTKLFTRY